MTGSKLFALWTVAATCVALTGGLVLTAPIAGGVTGHPPGIVGSRIVLANEKQLISYDVAANSAGRAYVGWIATEADTHRYVHLCTLAVTGTSCAGGVQMINALGDTSASGLRVLVTGNDTVKLVWFHDTDQSINGPENALISVASAAHGQGLALTSDTTPAPSFGSLLTAEIAPSGEIWTVAYEALDLRQRVQVTAGLTANFVNVSTPFPVGHAQLAFAGGKAVLAFERYGFQTIPTRYRVRSSGGTWSPVQSVAHTWSLDSGAALETTGHGLRIVSNVDNASYRPVIARWTGSGFAPRKLTADHDSCGAGSHDGYADPSGRLLDVSAECDRVAIANYPDAAHAAVVRFDGNGTPTFTPQIASGTRGIATVVWSVQGSTSNLYKLRVAHVRLPDPTVTVSHHATGGRVTVTGPRSCLPPVNVHVGWTHHPDANWSFLSGSLRLGTHAVVGSTLDGATLTPGKSYTLVATATFGRDGNRNQVRASLSFRTCGTG